MINFKRQKILVLAPHTDDAELGMGGTIAKIKREGGHLSIVAFSAAEDSLPEGFDRDSTRREFAESMALYEVDYFDVLNFQVREFPRDRQLILEELIRLRRDLVPDLVFCPSGSDIHQDHYTLYIEALRAFKSSTILCYEMPWNCLKLNGNFFIELQEQDFQRKLQSISVYKSQLAKNSIYLEHNFLISQLELNGARLGRKSRYELFEVLRIIT